MNRRLYLMSSVRYPTPEIDYSIYCLVRNFLLQSIPIVAPGVIGHCFPFWSDFNIVCIQWKASLGKHYPQYCAGRIRCPVDNMRRENGDLLTVRLIRLASNISLTDCSVYWGWGTYVDVMFVGGRILLEQPGNSLSRAYPFSRRIAQKIHFVFLFQ